METVKFQGIRIRLPWSGWDGFEICPAGLITSRGLLSPATIDLLFFKAAYYDRGYRVREDAIHASTNS